MPHSTTRRRTAIAAVAQAPSPGARARAGGARTRAPYTGARKHTRRTCARRGEPGRREVAGHGAS
ncbi:hypothetical protein C0216_32185 (plasmid) [Streptomyces globosus]|uniref:Uncharacterized protein n=1 Tax=Streptomyces globosus TaxID=68209 RepID=A0A344UB79_9ACTN|nr:hypothetical protein [Streptomyces globosus]AXE28150.1 hypothetical protein C0216_32185 [Streptomyces globosus]